jgi:hypothetical protein
METLEQMIESLAKEIKRNIKAMSGIKNLDQRKTQAEIIKLLCESMGVFFSSIAAIRPEYDDDYEDDDDFYEEDFYDDGDDDGYERFESDMKKVTPFKKKKKGKKDDSEDIPF